MTASDRFDLLFADALEDLAGTQYPDYFDDVLDVATRRAQRPAWTFLERWIPMDTATRRTVFAPTVPWRQVGLIAVIIALVVAATAVVIIGSQPRSRPAPPFGPAANGLVAYGVDGDVFVRDLRGGPPRKLTDTPEYDVVPHFSRDGTMFTFVRLNADPFNAEDEITAEDLFVANADGTNVRLLLASSLVAGWSWSVDGSQVAAIAEVDGRHSLFVVNVADGSQRLLDTGNVTPLEAIDYRPPDGRELIFRGEEGSKVAIYGILPDGSGLRQISPDGTNMDFWTASGTSQYAVTPDGDKLIYGQGDTRVDLRMLDLNTGEDTLWGGALEVLQGELGAAFLGDWGAAVLSPDGTRLAFGRYWNDYGGTLNHQVFVATLASDGADAIAIGEPHRSPGGVDPFGYTWSPDGEYLIVDYTDQEVTWLVNPDDGSYTVQPWGNVIDTPSWQRIAAE